MAVVTVICLGAAFYLAGDARFLAPGPLTSAHSAIENCSDCHTKSGSGQLSWITGLVARDPIADSEACLGCHRMPDTALNAHGAATGVLEESTKRLTKVAAQTPAPPWTRAQAAAFPTHNMASRSLPCATCHQEHKGASFNLSKISSEQCQSCHVVKFDSFDGNHPKFENYPFKRRTPIIYDHAGHSRHFSELAKKDPTKRIPATCSSCHNSQADRRVMAVAPFEQTCSSCHLSQITGKERLSGPKGIAFLSLPGLDLQTLKRKNAEIGEWPTDSEAELTPFMKVMISRTDRGRALIKAVDNLNLQDLSDATDDQIAAVTALVWEIKRLFYALIAGKASDVLGDLNIDCGAKLSPSLVADLTASIPRDVLVSAHQQWLPNLGTEMADRPDTGHEQTCWITTLGGWVTTTTEPRSIIDSDAPAEAPAAETAGEAPGPAPAPAPVEVAARPQLDIGAGIARELRVDLYGGLKRPQDEAAKAPKAEAPAAVAAPPREAPGKAEVPSARPAEAQQRVADEQPRARAAEPPPARAADQTDDLLNLTEEELREFGRPGGAAVRGYTAYALPGGGRVTLSAEEQPRAVSPGSGGALVIAQADGAARRPAPPVVPGSRAPDQTDDLLNPTEDELRGTAAPGNEAARPAPPAEAAGAPAPANASADAAPKADAPAPSEAPAPPAAPAAAPQPRGAPVISIESNVDPESWAEYGGWYRQDYAIYYRPAGHKDKFIFSWLFLTGPQSPKGDRSPAAAVFDYLTSKDAQGSCTKCHSVDDIRSKGRLVNFSPTKLETKVGQFTTFIHEPHFSVLENRGCLTCHSLEKGRPYLESYRQGNPKEFVSNFGAVDKDLCQSCHTSGMARQDCLLCHKYHVNGVTMPMMNTKFPTE